MTYDEVEYLKPEDYQPVKEQNEGVGNIILFFLFIIAFALSCIIVSHLANGQIINL